MKNIVLLISVLLITISISAQPIREASAVQMGTFLNSSMPYDAEVEWIGVSENGYPYIDTGWKPQNPFYVRAYIMPGVSSGDHYLLGSRDALYANAKGIGLGTYGSGYRIHTSRVGAFADNPYVYSVCRYIPDEFGEVEFGVTDDEIYCSTSINTVRVPISSERGTDLWDQGPGNLLLFAYTSRNPGWSTKTLRIGNIKIFDNGVLVRDYIPVRVGEIGYMFDCVNGELYGNSGTGYFTVGPDKE